ncbi:hypothetical protein MYP_4209 [Sporocytophaga myxococcoides]|uniref:Secreted protein n=1 Tax=Sporocytophaga myxococcoides TaxID=153721 RepID=A0A098LKG8_9BACT|nr:hypothetical protein [Sporocytophaga myxococcoides]GAL86979.1 hypothetical protein MYP_4209 [Sporocytophaga myxococcoides]
MKLTKLSIFLLSLISINLYAQTGGLVSEEIQSSEYKPGKIVTLKDTIKCFIIDRGYEYYFNGNIKYKLQLSDSKSLKIKSKDILHLELDGKAHFDRLPYGLQSFLMVKHVDGYVKLYETAIDGFDDYGTYSNGGMNTTNNPNLDRFFLVRESLIIKVSRRMSGSDIKKIFPDDNEFLKQFEKMDYQKFLKNIKQLVIDYNNSIKKKAEENQ